VISEGNRIEGSPLRGDGLFVKRRKTMETKLIVTYIVCDDVVKNLKIKEDVQLKMNAAAQYSGNFEKARIALKNSGDIPDIQFSRIRL
jgi:hypothetical protein